MSDQLHRFVFEHCELRGVLVHLDNSLKGSLDAHDYPPAVRDFLAQALAAIAMLSSTIKIKGRVSLQLKGQGALSLLLAECSDDFGVRAIARVQHDITETDFSHLVAGGVLALSLLPENGTPYQGMVPLQGQSLAHCLQHYFAQSEQLTTALHLVFDGQRAAGLLVQALPGANADDIERIMALTHTITADELLHLPVETVLHRLYHEEAVRLFAPQALRFQCRCSREKMHDSLRLLDAAELHEMLQEQERIRVSCEFCHRVYDFDAVDVAALNAPGAPSSSRH